MIILASNSPRRKELLRLICPSFAIEPADIDEHVSDNLPLNEIPACLARQKAAFVHQKHPDDIVLGCDTGVFINNLMLGKPGTDRSAYEMLKLLSGKTHKVITGCALMQGEDEIVFSQVTEVEFYPLTDAEIRAYIQTGEPNDKAGAYGIQGKGALLVKQIKGDYNNVVGLPVALLHRKLQLMQTSCEA